MQRTTHVPGNGGRLGRRSTQKGELDLRYQYGYKHDGMLVSQYVCGTVPVLTTNPGRYSSTHFHIACSPKVLLAAYRSNPPLGPGMESSLILLRASSFHVSTVMLALSELPCSWEDVKTAASDDEVYTNRLMVFSPAALVRIFRFVSTTCEIRAGVWPNIVAICATPQTPGSSAESMYLCIQPGRVYL